jgi:hypothetical protein
VRDDEPSSLLVRRRRLSGLAAGRARLSPA